MSRRRIAADYTIELHTEDFRGDHSADVVIAHEFNRLDILGHLADRLLDGEKLSAHIVIRRIQRREEKTP